MNNIDLLESRFRKLWLVEASLYSFSINLSLALSNAFMIKVLGYGIGELGLLVAIRVLAVALSQFPATLLVLEYRGKRKTIWLIAGGVNRLGWALVPLAMLLHRPLDFMYLSALTMITQFTGGVAGVAAMDTVGDNIPGSKATSVFSSLSRLSNIAILLSQLIGIAIFTLVDKSIDAYLLIYVLAFISALISTIILYYTPDRGVYLGRQLITGWSSVSDVIKDGKLSKYLFVISMFNFAVNIPAPFWDYIVLGISGGLDALIPVKNMVALGVKALAVNWWQKLTTRHGLRKTLIEGMAFTSIIPVMYVEASRAIDIVLVEAYSGFVWTPVDICVSIYNVYLPSRDIRPVYVSTVNFLTNTVASIASSIGTVIASVSGSIATALVTSTILRALTASIAYKILPDIRENRSVEKTSSPIK